MLLESWETAGRTQPCDVKILHYLCIFKEFISSSFLNFNNILLIVALKQIFHCMDKWP